MTALRVAALTEAAVIAVAFIVICLPRLRLPRTVRFEKAAAQGAVETHVAADPHLRRWAEKNLRSRSGLRRAQAVRCAVVGGIDPGVVAPLLVDPHPAVRAAAAASVVGHLPAAEQVVALLSDPDPLVAAASAGALRRWPGAAGAVGDALVCGKPTKALLGVASTLSDPRCAQVAAPLARATDPEVRSACAAVCASVRLPITDAALHRLCTDADAGVRRAAADAIATNAHRGDIDVLVGLLGDPDSSVQRAAAAALAAAGPRGELELRRAALRART